MLLYMKEMFDKVLDILLKLFPVSPFAPYIAALGDLPYLGYINWFIPVGTFVKIGTAWLGAIAVYYLYMVIARWVKLIG